MNPDKITLFLSFGTAESAAMRENQRNPQVRDWAIMPGTVRWNDGTMDRGYKVRLYHRDGTVAYL